VFSIRRLLAPVFRSADTESFESPPTILECRFNKTTHHQQSKKPNLFWA
jgi:hypothetical protein